MQTAALPSCSGAVSFAENTAINTENTYTNIYKNDGTKLARLESKNFAHCEYCEYPQPEQELGKVPSCISSKVLCELCIVLGSEAPFEDTLPMGSALIQRSTLLSHENH